MSFLDCLWDSQTLMCKGFIDQRCMETSRLILCIIFDEWLKRFSQKNLTLSSFISALTSLDTKHYVRGSSVLLHSTLRPIGPKGFGSRSFLLRFVLWKSRGLECWLFGGIKAPEVFSSPSLLRD